MVFNKTKVIKMISDGLTVGEIAQLLNYSEGTIRNYMSANGIKVREIKLQALKDQVNEQA